MFEIAKTGGGYASTPTTLVSFNGTNGEYPFAGLIADAAGDLFGTTIDGGANGDGTVFEIAKTGGGYAGTPTITGQLQRHQRVKPVCRSDRRRRRGPLRHDDYGWGERRGHGVRDSQDHQRLRRHADHTGQLQRHQRD